MNLLENALEANEKAPEGADKWAPGDHAHPGRVSVCRGGERLLRPGGLRPGGAAVPRHQARTLHGMGLKSARATARKYHSELVLKADGDAFSASTALLLSHKRA